MNRREFLGYCVAAGMTLGLGGPAFCMGSKRFLSPSEKAQLRGFPVADAHAHPNQLHGSRHYDASTPDVEMMKEVGMVAGSFAAVGDMVKYGTVPGSPFYDTLNQLKKVIKLEEKEKIRLIRKAADISLSTGPDDPLGAVMAVEGGDALEGKKGKLDELYRYGVRMITVVHAHDNEIGFNQRSRSDGPLTPFGVQVIEKMNELGMVVDVAHSRARTLKGIAEVCATPLVDSHTNPIPDGTGPSKPSRLRTWAEMELIAGTGGIICTWPLAYHKGGHPRTTLRHWAEDIVEIKRRLGMEHAGLGTDGGGNLPQRVKGWESIVSLPGLIGAMREVGLSQQDIAAYVGGNFLRILNRCLG